jgi:hypothetical protein
MRNLREKRAATTIGAVAAMLATASARVVAVSAARAAQVPASAVLEVARVRAQPATTIRIAGHDLRGAERAATGVPRLRKDAGVVTDSVAIGGAGTADRAPVSSPGLMIEDRASGPAREAFIVRIVITYRTVDALRAGIGVADQVLDRRQVSAAVPVRGKLSACWKSCATKWRA